MTGSNIDIQKQADPKVLQEALELSSEILQNIELSEIPLNNIALKTSRLARLLNDSEMQKIFAYEAGGYTSAADGVPPEVFSLAIKAGRQTPLSGSNKGPFIYTTSIEQLEEQIDTGKLALKVANDANSQVSSANPDQFVWGPTGNFYERKTLREDIAIAQSRLASRRAYIHQYALKKHTELKFSDIADDVFTRIRLRNDKHIGTFMPESISRITAIYDNLESSNKEDWSNAVHSCRRLLQDLADIVFPPTNDTRSSTDGKGKSIQISLGKENYINRLLAFVEDCSDSKRFEELIGSHIKYLGERLDAVFKASQKGSHDVISTKEEAERYFVFAYLIISDILALRVTSSR